MAAKARKKTPKPKGRRAAKVRIPLTLKNYRYDLAGQEFAQGLPAELSMVSCVEDESLPNFFAIAEIEGEHDRLPVIVNGALPPEIDFETFAIKRQAEIEAEITERIDGVPEHRRCPVCWGNWKGKALPKQRSWQRINGKKTKVGYRCDACGFEWSVVIETHQMFTVEGFDRGVLFHDEDKGLLEREGVTA